MKNFKVRNLKKTALIFAFGLSGISSGMGQESNEIFTFYDINNIHPDSGKRTFFISGEIADKLIKLERKPFIYREHILMINKIPGIDEKVKIKLCEGSRNKDGSSIQGYGCWTNFKGEKYPVPDEEIWGVILHITNLKNELIINNPVEERYVKIFLGSIK